MRPLFALLNLAPNAITTRTDGLLRLEAVWSREFRTFHWDVINGHRTAMSMQVAGP